MRKIALSFVACLFVGACVAGCGRGTEQWFEKANPQTSVKVGYNPFSQTFDVDAFSNDGRSITADELHAKAGEKEFTAKNLRITERSVENRQANVAQIEASGQAVASVATANWTGFTQAIQAAAPIAAPYLQGLAAAKLAKAQRPGLVEQLAGLVVSGQTSGAALREIDVPPDILAEVERIVDMKLAAMKAAAESATTTPADQVQPITERNQPPIAPLLETAGGRRVMANAVIKN